MIAQGIFTTDLTSRALQELAEKGSYAASGFMNPEGIVVHHIAGNVNFKITLGGDGAKGES